MSSHRDDGYYSANPSFTSLSQTLNLDEDQQRDKEKDRQRDKEKDRQRDTNFLADLLLFQQKQQQQYSASPTSPTAGSASFQLPLTSTSAMATDTAVDDPVRLEEVPMPVMETMDSLETGDASMSLEGVPMPVTETMDSLETGGASMSNVITAPVHLYENLDNEDAETIMTDSEVDSAYDDASSLLGGDTKSLSTYITDYRVEHGRRYHSFKDGAYWV
jgi:hypothetical protein